MGSPTASQLFAANLKRLRRASDLTQEALAELLEVDLRYVQRLEAGTLDLRLSTLDHVARTLRIQVADLLAPAKIERARRGRPPSA